MCSFSNKNKQGFGVPMQRYLLNPKVTNEFGYLCDREFYWWERQVNNIKNACCLSGLPYLPDEIWLIIVKFQMYLDKQECKEFYDWFYCDENKKGIQGMNLRSRQLWIPNVAGIVFNDCFRIIYRAEKSFKLTTIEEKRINLDSLSDYFLRYIVRWYHWIYEASLNIESYDYFIIRLHDKAYYFVTHCHDPSNSTKYSKKNFDMAYYFIFTYYRNYLSNSLTHKDIDFENRVFRPNYYNRVFKKSMLLRSGRRINMFLHE